MIFRARPKKVGLVLGGGGSRGIAHVGVLEVLAREGINIEVLVGTSMGGVVAALYAQGRDPKSLITHIAELKDSHRLLSMNLIRAKARQRMLKKWLHGLFTECCIEDLPVPLVLMAADLITGQEVRLTHGPLIPALLATCAVPVVLPPVEIDNMLLADGGVIDSLAVSAAYDAGAEYVIAVDIHPPVERLDEWIDPIEAITGLGLPLPSRRSNPPLSGAIWRTFQVLTWQLHQARLAAQPPDLLLRPDVTEYRLLDFDDLDGPYRAGIAAAEAHIEALHKLATS